MVDTLKLENAAREVLEEWLEFFDSKNGFTAELIVDQDKKRFVLMNENWHDYLRSYGPVIDVSIRNGKIWIHEDNTEDGIPDELVAKGIPPQQIVLGWQPEYKRDLTGFAVG